MRCFAVLSLAASLIAVSSCSQNPQVVLLQGGQSVTTLLRTAQIAENTFCMVDTQTPTHCDATIPGLTPATLDSVHQKFEGAMATAFKDKLAFDAAAAAWQPGQGAPTSLLSLQADANLALSTLESISTSPGLTNALKSIQDVVNAIVSTVQAVTGKEPTPPDPCVQNYPHVARLCQAARWFFTPFSQ
jgi:hypothetical protein